MMSLARLAPLVVAAAGLARAVLAGAPIPLTFSSPPTGAVVQSNFLGLSIELSYLDVYFGNDTNSVPPQILTHLGALRNQTGTQPLRMRLGGNSMDSSTYVASQTSPMEEPNHPGDNWNDVSVNFGPTLWDQLVTVGDAVGGSTYVIGLSLLAQDDTRFPDIPSMASGAKEALGDRLDTLLLGNEPDMYQNHKKRPQYHNYTSAIYYDEFQNVSSTLGNVNSPAILGGPTICCQWDLATMIQEGYVNQFKNELNYVSLQHYPQNYCNKTFSLTHGLPYYGQHNQATELARWNAPGVSLALTAGMRVMMSEFNSVSCGGAPGISNTFLAGALWTLDYSMQLATIGFSAAYLHLREPGTTYNPLQVVQGGWQTKPGYHALLVAPQVLGSGSPSRIVDLNIGNSMFDGTQQQAGYATYDNATNAISRIALFNFADGHANMTFTIPKEVFDNSTKLKLPNANPNRVTVKYLTAASTGEEFDVSWAGTTYNGVLDGKPVPDTSGRPAIVTLDCSHGCSVDVPGPGMALVFVGPEPVPATVKGTSNVTASATGTVGADSAPTTGAGASTKTNHADQAGPLALLAVLATSALGLALYV